MDMNVIQRGKGKAAFSFILLIVLLDALSMGLVFPVLPQLVIALGGGDAAHGSRMFGWMAAAWSVMHFLAAPILGGLSDRFGRRPVILISAFGLAVDLVIMALAPTLAWLFVGRLLSGVTAASQSTATAYIADVTPPEQRAQRFGLLSGIYGVGLILGPAAGGLLGGIDVRAPFWAAAALTVLSWLYGLIVLPESLAPENRAPFPWRAVIPAKSFGILAKYEGLASLASILTIVQLGAHAVNTLVVLYSAHRFGWTPVNIGLAFMVYSAGTIAITAVVSPKLVQLWGERLVILSGLFVWVVGFVILGLAPNGAWFLVSSIFICFGNITVPPLQALLSNKVGPDEQGRLQGTISALMAVTGMVGPILFSQIFAWSIMAGSPPAKSGIAFLLGGALIALSWLLAWKVAKNAKAGEAGSGGAAVDVLPQPDA